LDRIFFCIIQKSNRRRYSIIWKKYKNSSEEFEDLKSNYLKFEGDMNLIMDSMILSTEEDYERFKNILNDLIERKEIPKMKAFNKQRDS